MPISKYALKRRIAHLEQSICDLGYDQPDTLAAWFERHCAKTPPPLGRLEFLAFQAAFLAHVLDRRHRLATRPPQRRTEG